MPLAKAGVDAYGLQQGIVTKIDVTDAPGPPAGNEAPVRRAFGGRAAVVR